MSKRSQKPVKAAASVPTGYGPLLAELKSRVRAAQVRAALSVNRALIALYWDIGRVILQRQQAEGWGAKVVARLAADLRQEFPEIKGFSARNLDYMLAFAQAWGGDVILQQPVAKLAVGNATSPEQQSTGKDSFTGVIESVRPNVSRPVIQLPGGKLSQPATESPTVTGAIVQQVVGESSGSILQQAVALSPATPPEPVASLPWGHNLVVLTKLKKPAERLWYAKAALQYGWSRTVLTMQIETQAHRRMGRAVTNFARTLPPPQSDLAQHLSADERGEVKKVARLLLERIKALLVLDWRKRQSSRARVEDAIKDLLDTGLPRVYSPELYQKKCSAVFQHVYESYADQGDCIYAAAN